MSPAYVVQTDHLSSGCCCKTISRKKTKSPANTFSQTHTHDMRVEILTVYHHAYCTDTHTHTHASPRWTWRINFTGRVPLPLRLKWNHTGPRPPSAHLEALLQKAAVASSSSCTVLLILSPHYKSHLTVSVIIPHMLMQQSSSQAK